MPRYIKLLAVLIFVIFGGSFSSCKPEPISPHDQAMICIQDGDLVGFETLIKSNPSLIRTVEYYEKRTLLHSVFSKGYFDDKLESMSDLLIAAGADINSTDDRGMTPAHCAAYYGHGGRETLDYLVGKGANPALKDREGKTPIDYLSKSSD